LKAELDGSAPAPFPQSAQYQKAFKEEKDPGGRFARNLRLNRQF